MSKQPRRPRDLNQWAKHMLDLATGAASDSPAEPKKSVHSEAAATLGRLGGIKGGKARAKKLSPKRLKEIGKLGAAARWKRAKDKKHD